MILSEFGLGYLNSPTPPFVSKDVFDKELSAFLHIQNFYTNDLIEDSIKQEYVDWAMADDPEADYFDPWKYSVGDFVFSCPAVLETYYHAMAADSAEYEIYQYYFTYAPNISIFKPFYPELGWLGAGHGEEMQFTFGYPFLYPGDYTDEKELDLSHRLIKYWSNFAKTG